MSDSLDIQVDDGLMELTLRRPAARNAIDGDTAVLMSSTLRQASLDSDIRAVLFTGEGRDFCTGADMASAGEQAATLTPLDYRWATLTFYELTRSLWEIEKPVVTAVNGTVAGLGWSLALLGDLVVADRTARWSHVFTRRGMVPHAGDTYYLPRILPMHQLMELALLSDTITSERLAAIGAINRLVDGDDVLPQARELARRLADGPTRTLGLTKQLYRNSLHRDIEAVFEAERNATALISTTHDRVEGVKSLIERRSPDFTGN
ncbi:MAG: enoyl-CoA hydratase/isomerase family protein [Acidobacteriota bacterium]|nr:enoyl-CoA hydratase/isomerase family protein [Acidobacteriota bacterium]